MAREKWEIDRDREIAEAKAGFAGMIALAVTVTAEAVVAAQHEFRIAPDEARARAVKTHGAAFAWRAFASPATVALDAYFEMFRGKAK